jgi:hypothetical protein
MMVIIAPQTVHMQRDPRRARKTLEAVRDHLGAEVANLFALEPEVCDAEGSVRQVDYRTAERLVERAVGVSEAGEARGRAEGQGEGGAEGDADVFGCVVVVD